MERGSLGVYAWAYRSAFSNIVEISSLCCVFWLLRGGASGSSFIQRWVSYFYILAYVWHKRVPHSGALPDTDPLFKQADATNRHLRSSGDPNKHPFRIPDQNQVGELILIFISMAQYVGHFVAWFTIWPTFVLKLTIQVLS